MRRKSVLSVVATIFLCLFVFSSSVLAHPGRTDSYGGHYVRTGGWGYTVGTYHYHSGPYAGYSVSYKGEVPAAFKQQSAKSTTKVPVKQPSFTGTVPSFSIKINNQIVDNLNSQYPFLIYKNVTYMPLTYSICNDLGINIVWDISSGLTLTKELVVGFDGSFVIDPSNGTKNLSGAIQQFTLPTFNITVNGQYFINSSQEYPFLVFRGITYMPLTWNNVVGQFGLNMNWNQLESLSISR